MTPKLTLRALSNNGIKSNYFIKGMPVIQLTNITSDYSLKPGPSMLPAGRKKESGFAFLIVKFC